MPRWRTADPLVVDVLLAVLCAVVTLVTVGLSDSPFQDGDLDGTAVLLILGQTMPVAIRRRDPVLAWLLVGAATTAYGVGEFPDTVLDVGPLLVIYTVAAEAPRRTATALGILTLLTILAALTSAGDADAKDVSYNILVYATAWIVGEHHRSRRAAAEVLARRAVSDERARIASELHDVVAHHVSMIVVQAEGGASVVGREPARAQEAFDAISATGRQAMGEMRRIVDVLREEDGDGRGRLDPHPGLHALDALAERVRQAGLPVEVHREGRPRDLPAGLDLSAYRIVQEALTNTVRHADAGRATVVLRYADEWLEVEVADDGKGPAGHAPPGGGHGLVGMRERVALFGGELRTGAGENGGFVVVARLPVGL